MKTIQNIIILSLVIIATSCATSKKADDNTISKERMELDAYAMANIECEYKIAQMQKDNNTDDKMQKVEFDNLNKQIGFFSKEIRKRYNSTNQLDDFYILVEKLKPELTTCKKLEELKNPEIEQQEKKK